MITNIAVTAGEIWLEIDRGEFAFKEVLLKRLETKERSRELLLMALGWLLYEGHVRWTPGDMGGRLMVNRRHKEDDEHEEPNQNRFAAHSA